MKIAFIGQKGIPAKFGGVEKHVEDLATRLVKAGHEIYIYTRPNYTNKNLKKYKGINLISLPNIPTKHLDAISHTFLACLDIIKMDIDIIHFHSIGPSSLIWLVKIFKPSVSVVATFHSKCYLHKKWGRIARTYLKLGEKTICWLPDITICVSKTLARYAKDSYDCLTRYIPNGVNLPKNLVAKEINKWGIKKENYILTVSRLIRHKGLHNLISAFQNLKTNKKLIIVGDGYYTDSYVEELKLLARGNKNIIFTGNQTGRALAELFSNAYLFVQPSESEGLSIALLEAMSYGRGVLASDIPENKEAIGKIGFTFENKNTRSLENKLAYLLKCPALIKARGGLGRARVKELYNWNEITKNTIKVYKEILREKQESGVRLPRIEVVKRFMGILF